MNSSLAISILLKDTDIDDLSLDENKWKMHSLYVGQAAGRIARHLSIDNVDADYASAIGYLHDIGRIVNSNNHVIDGYKYLDKLGYLKEARYCITHSFVNNNINDTAGGGPKDQDSYNFINNYLNNTKPNIYDNIIQLCDLFCSSSGYTTFEKRILDITKRKGVYPNSQEHFEEVMKLKNEIEEMMGIKIYDLFPQIKKEDLDSRKDDYNELMELFKTKKK